MTRVLNVFNILLWFDHGKFDKSAGENEYGAPAHMAIEGFGAKHEDLAKHPRFSLMSRVNPRFVFKPDKFVGFRCSGYINSRPSSFHNAPQWIKKINEAEKIQRSFTRPSLYRPLVTGAQSFPPSPEGKKTPLIPLENPSLSRGFQAEIFFS